MKRQLVVFVLLFLVVAGLTTADSLTAPSPSPSSVPTKAEAPEISPVKANYYTTPASLPKAYEGDIFEAPMGGPSAAPSEGDVSQAPTGGPSTAPSEGYIFEAPTGGPSAAPSVGHIFEAPTGGPSAAPSEGDISFPPMEGPTPAANEGDISSPPMEGPSAAPGESPNAASPSGVLDEEGFLVDPDTPDIEPPSPAPEISQVAEADVDAALMSKVASPSPAGHAPLSKAHTLEISSTLLMSAVVGVLSL